VLGELAAHGTAVAQRAVEPADPDRLALLGRGADHALAEADLGADAALPVAAARDREQPSSGLVRQQQQAVIEAEVLGERAEHQLEQLLEIARRVDARGDALQRPDLRAQRGRGRLQAHGRRIGAELVGVWQRRPGAALDLEKLVHVGGEQAEDARHPGVRRDRLDPRRHLIEQRTARLRTHEAHAQPVGGERQRVPQHDQRLRILEHVAHGLVEELA
jgi:hypothetical protein